MADIDRGPASKGRPFSEMRDTGLLWLLNRVVFHPRGFALGFELDADGTTVTGWQLLGHGDESWNYDTASVDEDELFRAVEALFNEQRTKEADQ